MKTVIFRGSIPLGFADFPNITCQKCGVRTWISKIKTLTEGWRAGRAPPYPFVDDKTVGAMNQI